MSSTQLQAVSGALPGHSIVMLSHAVRVAIQRGADGRVTGMECLQADDTRRKLVEAVAKEIARGRPVEDLLLRALAVCDLLRGLAFLKQPEGKGV